jgi:poly(hydroxyalkanoate) depolymerase family esterase
MEHFGKAAARLMGFAWLTPQTLPETEPPRKRIVEEEHFGSNPGQLRMLVFHPRRKPPAGAPLIVVLHGCGQDGAGFAEQSGWLTLAETLGIPLVLPEQARSNHRNRCFNWYRPMDVGRGRGEAMSIRQMVRHASREFGSDRRRIFIVGLSAGGAMAAAMLAAYPAVFAAGAVAAGMPVGTAQSSPMALLRMHRADAFSTRIGLAAAVRARTAPRGHQPWPRLSIWQGGRDRTVDPDNAEILANQWAELHGCTEEPTHDSHDNPQARRRVWARRGTPVLELWTLPEMGHGFPIAEGLGSPAPWVLKAGVSAVRHIAAFWGLERS